ncbi:glutathione S-transferase family protein [Emcibacter sp.]|uniref:glutathione S-transferase family protein n=1 Tax=Emcibacter sp. TaxID=1979954 RepID=UPI003A9108BD
MITLYGSKMSRAAVVIWAAEELGIELDIKPYNPRSPETQSEEYRKINPTGKVPTLVDGDFVLTESVAICVYLARKYGGGRLLGTTPEEEADILRWCFFGMTEIDAFAFQLLMETKFRPGEPSETFCNDCKGWLGSALNVLESALEGKQWLVGSEMTLADLVGIRCAGFILYVGLTLDDWPNIAAWVKRGAGRPAYPS